MIDKDKWEKCPDDMKMKTIEVIRSVVTDRSVTKSDHQLINDYLLSRVVDK